jgi:beta-glucosidase
MYERGVGLGEEARGKGVNVLLGPSVGALGRKPRGGRNWEGFGADPILQGFGGAQTVKGMQSTGTIAAIKHYIGNEQEMHRMSSVATKGYSSNIDDRTLHELYLWPFAQGVRAGVGSLMTAYSDVGVLDSLFVRMLLTSDRSIALHAPKTASCLMIFSKMSLASKDL